MKYLKLDFKNEAELLKYKAFEETVNGTLLCLNGSVIEERIAKGKWLKMKAEVKPSKAQTRLGVLGMLQTPSTELAIITGSAPQTRVKVIQKIWKYIKEKDLQNKVNKRNIDVGNDKYMSLIFSKKQISMFELSKELGKHLTPYKGK